MGAPHGGLGKRHATFEVLARAVCPDEEMSVDLLSRTVSQTARLVDGLAPPMRGAIMTTAGALEVITVRRRFGYRRFSQLEPGEARSAVMWLGRTHPRLWRVLRLLRDLVVFSYFEQPDVRASVGYDPDPFIAAVSSVRVGRWGDAIEAHRRLLLAPAPRPGADTGSVDPGSIHSARDEPLADLTCDVVVVGSGAGGAVVAAELAEAGFSVIVLEEGGHHPSHEFTSDTAEMVRTLYRSCGVSSTLGRTPVAYSEGCCVGGSTVVNGAMAFRAPEDVLRRWAVATAIPELACGGLDLEYERVERFLSVTTQDEPSIGRDQELLRRGASQLGWRVIDNTRAQVHCAGCNVCTWGCPTGAKQSTLVSYIPRALAFGATVWSDCRVDRVMFEGKRAIGVQGRVTRGPDSETPRVPRFTVHAKQVVLACGAVQTPALLQRSGVRSPSGELGRNLSLHPGVGVTAVFDEPVDGWKGAHQAYQVREFQKEGFILAAVNLPPSLVARSLPMVGSDLGEQMAAYNRTVTAGVLVEDTSTGRVRAVGREGTLVTYRINERDTSTIVRATLLLSEALFAAGATVIHLPFEGVGAVRNVDELHHVAALHPASEDLNALTVHLMGTTRFGADPTRAVCDPWGAVYDRVGLSVADASLFPGPVAVNPMLTIQALATRIAWHTADSWPT
jgi:choline dehydrogenase-like flavoprotein